MSGMPALARSRPPTPAAGRARPAAPLVGLTVALVADGNAFLGLAFAFLWLSHVPSGVARDAWRPFVPLGLWVGATLAVAASALHGFLAFVRAPASTAAEARLMGHSAHRLLAFGAGVLVSACAWQAIAVARTVQVPFASLRALTLVLFAAHQLVTLLPGSRPGRWRFLYAAYLGLVWLLLTGACLVGRALLPGQP